MRQLAVAALAIIGLAGLVRAQETPGADGPTHRVEAADIDKYILEKKVFFLDVREPTELEELGTLEEFYNIPLGELDKRFGELPKDKLILTA
jgi:hypothetical protein